MRAFPIFVKSQFQRYAIRTVFTCGLLFCAGAMPLFAQGDESQSDQPRHNDRTMERGRTGPSGSSAVGGNWRVFESEDKMTAARTVRFELLSDNAPAENHGYQYKIELVCENGKYKGSEFTPGRTLGPPNRPGWWGQPQMEVLVRVDNRHGNHGWNWNGHFLAMDKGTTRELIGAQIFKVEFLGYERPEIAEFSPAGLDLTRVSQACGLTPKKP
jgi:hypothetical protein